MPVVIFEGASGTGKTTAALELSKRTGWPIYRAFRGDPNEHDPGSSCSRIGLIPIETNTWRPDLAVADFISQSRSANVIMDRTLISGLAHDPSMWDGPPPDSHGNDDWVEWGSAGRDNATQLSRSGLATLEEWATMMSKVWTLLVDVRMPEYIRVARGGRNGAWEVNAISHIISKLPMGMIRTILCLNDSTNDIVNMAMEEMRSDSLGSGFA